MRNPRIVPEERYFAGGMKRYVTIAAIQSRAHQDPGINLRKAETLIRQAARKGARIVCLPELYRTVYFPQYRKRDVGNPPGF